MVGEDEVGITSRVAVCVLLLAAESTQGKHHSCLVEPPFPQLKAHFFAFYELHNDRSR